MTTLAGVPARSDLGRWAGLADPAPDRPRVAGAVAAAVLTVLLTVVGSDPAALGAGAGRLFLVFAIVVGPAVAALLVLRPWSGLVAWAAMMALLNVARLQAWIGPVQVTQSTIFVGALVIGVLLDRAAAAAPAGGIEADGPPIAAERQAWPRNATLVAAGLIAFPVLSLLVSPARDAGIPIVLHGVVEPVLAGLLVLAMRPTPRRSLALGGAIVLGLTLASVYSILRIGRVATTVAALEEVRVQLAHFTFYNVGIYGNVLAMTIPLAVAGLLWRRRLGLGRAASLALLAMLAILVAGLYLTFSKSAWLGAWLAVGLVALARFQRPRQIAAILAGAALAVTLIVPYPVYVLHALGVDSSAYEKVMTTVQGSRLSSWDVGSTEGEVSIGERWRATQAAVRMAVDHPLLGVGPGQFAEEYAGPYADPGATRHLGSAHDFLPEVAAELGLPTAALLVVTFLVALWAVWRAVRGRELVVRAVGAGFGAALVAFLAVTATFGLDLYRDYRVMNSDVVLAALIVGVCLSVGAWVTSRPEVGEPGEGG